jgi:Fic family protein
MLSFTPSQKIENKLKILQGLLAETYKDLEALSPDETKYIHRCAFISNIGASTRIENAVLTDQEIEWVDTILNDRGKATAFEEKKSFILDKLSKNRERSIDEVVGCRQVLRTVYLQADELFPLSEVTIRGLHHDLLRYYPKASSIITATAMADLINWYNIAIQEYPWPILVATEFIFRFLAIHPFQDGNGRLGRALFILALFHSGDKYLMSIMPYIAIDRHIEQNHTLYYSILHQCSEGKFKADHTQYKLEPLAWFFINILESSLADIEIYRKRYNNRLF